MGPSIYACRPVLFLVDFYLGFVALHFSLRICWRSIQSIARQNRRDILDPNEVGCFHAIQRTVRRAWLCGLDPVSGKSFEHRRTWIQNRLQELAAILWLLESCHCQNKVHIPVSSNEWITQLFKDVWKTSSKFAIAVSQHKRLVAMWKIRCGWFRSKIVNVKDHCGRGSWRALRWANICCWSTIRAAWFARGRL